MFPTFFQLIESFTFRIWGALGWLSMAVCVGLACKWPVQALAACTYGAFMALVVVAVMLYRLVVQVEAAPHLLFRLEQVDPGELERQLELGKGVADVRRN